MLVREKGNEEWEDAEFYSRSDYEDFVAEKFAEWNFSLDPCEPEDFEMTVEVLNNEGELKTFYVSAQVDILFNANEMDEEQ